MAESLIRLVKYNLRYLGNPKWDSGVSPPELLAFIKQTKPGQALDLGCGSGTNLLTLGENGWRVTGVDFAYLAVKKARKKLAASGIIPEIYCSSVVKIDFISKKFDLVLDIGCFHGLAVREKRIYLENLKNLINTNGTFLIYGFLSQESDKSGISESYIDAFSQQLDFIHRADGYDQNGRKSVWLRFCQRDFL